MNNFELHGKKPYRNRDSQTTFVWSKFLGNDCWVTKPEQLLRVLVWGLAIGQHPPVLDVVRLCVNFFLLSDCSAPRQQCWTRGSTWTTRSVKFCLAMFYQLSLRKRIRSITDIDFTTCLNSRSAVVRAGYTPDPPAAA